MTATPWHVSDDSAETPAQFVGQSHNSGELRKAETTPIYASAMKKHAAKAYLVKDLQKIVCTHMPPAADYILGIGQAFDPLPKTYSPTFISVDAVAFALDSYILRCDVDVAGIKIGTFKNASQNNSYPSKSVNGKTVRISEKA